MADRSLRCAIPSRYDHLTLDELVRLLEARDRRDATRFGLVWEANEIKRDRAIKIGVTPHGCMKL